MGTNAFARSYNKRVKVQRRSAAAGTIQDRFAANSPAILDIWCHLDVKYGGIGPAASLLSHAVQEIGGQKIASIAICRAGEIRPTAAHLQYTKRLDMSSLRPISDIKMGPMLRAEIEQCGVCHVHGLWLPHALAARRIANRLGKPVVSSAHGMLEKWELNNKRLKKKIYSDLIERKSLATSACLRALSAQEGNEYRTYGLRNPIAIVPTGVAPLEPIDPSEFLDRNPMLIGKKIVLFLSRVHYKKGVLDLLKAWPAVVTKHPEAHLLIAGSEYEDTGEQARQIIASSKIGESVTLAGRVSDSDKVAALSKASCFCLPSYSEGLSAAVLEALSIGTAVVISRACNVDGVAECGAGFVIEPNSIEDLSQSIIRCLSLSEAEQKNMSNAARSLARSRYGWPALGKTMHSVYAWLLGGPKPSCVVE